jgi:chemotaxis protein MotA
MDVISIVGVIVAIGAIVGGQLLEGGNIGSLLQITAFIIVIGGTAGAIMLQSSTSVFVLGMRMARWVFQPPQVDPQAAIQQIVEWSATSRKGGLLALEPQIESVDDPFIKKALQMLIDGAEPEVLREAMELDISSYEEHYRAGAKVWESAGGYAPTIGILGAVMGLIHVMENLSDPAKLGGGIAVAFVATIYGVGSANLFFLPIASKLKSIVAQQVMIREMIIDGLVAISNGENPRVIETRLLGYLA